MTKLRLDQCAEGAEEHLKAKARVEEIRCDGSESGCYIDYETRRDKL